MIFSWLHFFHYTLKINGPTCIVDSIRNAIHFTLLTVHRWPYETLTACYLRNPIVLKQLPLAFIRKYRILRVQSLPDQLTAVMPCWHGCIVWSSPTEGNHLLRDGTLIRTLVIKLKHGSVIVSYLGCGTWWLIYIERDASQLNVIESESSWTFNSVRRRKRRPLGVPEGRPLGVPETCYRRFES